MSSSPAAGREAGQAEHRAPITLVHDAVAHEAVILAVVEHGQAEHPRVLDRPAHEFVILDAMAVVRDGDDPRLHHRAERREFLARQTFRDRTGREDVDARFLPGALDDPRDRRRVVGGRTGVGHADNRREAARRRRPGTGFDGFLSRLAGFAQVDVQVDQARRDDEIFRVDNVAKIGI